MTELSFSGAEGHRDPYSERTSLEFRFRARRFAKVQGLIEDILAERGEADIIDLGGTETYWLIGEDFIQRNRRRLRITLVNLELEPVRDGALFQSIIGDATDPALMLDRRFDLVHSNSVIEHVGRAEDMRRFAANVKRLSDRYYVQTPNYWFPFEPHFRFVGFQYLPERLRVALIRRFSLGFFKRIEDRAEAWNIVEHHRLLGTKEMARFFDDAVISHEKFLGANKSIIAIRG